MSLWRLAAALFGLGCLLTLSAQDDDMNVDDSGVDPKRVEAAVKKGVEWLLSKQNADGSWTASGTQGIEAHYPGGTTALVLLALLKGGVSPNDPRIKKGFDFCFHVTKKQPQPGGAAPPGDPSDSGGFEKRTYSVSCLILALAAKYHPDAAKKKSKRSSRRHKFSTEPYERKVRRDFGRKATPQDRKMIDELVKWLLSKQETNVWRYPGAAQDGNNEDASNTQYAMLALYTARRLGYSIPVETWTKVVDYFLKHQEKDGPEVEWFPVPGADFPISQLKKMEKAVLKEAAKIARRNRNMDPERIKTRVVTDNPYRKFGDEKKQMKARGWGYIPKGKASQYPEFERICGSMTTSGVAAMMICKAALEGTAYHKKHRDEIDRSIRDGAAWLAHNFSASTNPGKGGYHYYYLYGLERAGVLTLTRRFGKRDWYKEGAEYLLGQQRPEGCWPGSEQGGNAGGDITSPLVDTCFAILFLKKATAPLVVVPPQVYSGKGISLGDGKK